MKLNTKNRRRWLIGGGLLLATATPSFALFGFGDIVFDPSSYAELLTQSATAYNQLKTIENNITHFSFKGIWTTSLNKIEHANVKNLFGETDGVADALNTGSHAAADLAWSNATTAVDSYRCRLHCKTCRNQSTAFPARHDRDVRLRFARLHERRRSVPGGSCGQPQRRN